VKNIQVCTVAALLALLSVGCGGNTNLGSGKAACEAFCNKVEDACADAGTSSDPLPCPKKCDAMPSTLPVGCNSATQDWFNCLAGQEDVCAAFGSACSSQQALAQSVCFQ
jgi:cysteine sulfinate desulfinase/cysteine desulfurase-like protein